MNSLLLLLKGAAIGAANVIPGVSGGTMAFITGVYERLINALSGIDKELLTLIKRGDFKGVVEKMDLIFLMKVMLGVLLGVVSLGLILKPMFENYPKQTWGFFFGLILASIYFVGRLVTKWSPGTMVALVIGVAIAAGVSVLPPAQESTNFFYLMLCGAVAMCSMVLPGVSGSYVLLLMGNYQLIMLDVVHGVTHGNFEKVSLLVPVMLGAVLGLLAFAKVLRWIFREFHNVAVALLTGFVAGSLVVIWPWKNEVIATLVVGEVTKDKVTGYEWFMPDMGLQANWGIIALMVAGAGLVFGIEWAGSKFSKTTDASSADVSS